MAAGLGFKTFTTGEVLTAADVNGYLMQGVLVFASEAARDAAITSPQEGQFAFTKDNNSLWYYDSAAWVASGATGDIEGVTAGTGISGGGTSGTVTITNSMATEIDAKGDLVVGTGADTFSRLAVGTNGQVLTADSGEATGLKFATPAAGGLTLLETLALSGSSTTSATISGSYVNLLLVVKNVYGSAQSQLDVRFNGDTGNNYYTRRFRNVNGTVTATTSAATSRFTDFLTFDTSSTAYNTANAVFRVFRYTDTDIIYIETTGTSLETDYRSMTGQFLYDNAAAITSVTFLTSAGTFSGGTVYIYGEK
jgi:hypothetical protein